MFKKSISCLLSFAIFVSAISTTLQINLQSVEAATTGISTFSGSLNKSLTEGTNNGVPVYDTDVSVDNSAFLSFSMAKSPANTNIGPEEYYVLSYPIDNNLVLEMKVQKDDDSQATVIYTFKDGAGNIVDNTKNFKIFSYNSGYQLRDAFDTNGTPATGNYVVTNSVFNTADVNDTGNPKSAVFHIKKGNGFSFKYGKITAHIKWDENTNTFQFFSDGFYTGNIYNAKLEFYNENDELQASDSVDILTGLSLEKGTYGGDGLIDDTFIAAPFANADADVTPSTRYYEEDIVISPDIPGDSVNGITFGFTMPNVWDDATKTFTVSKFDASYTMNLNLSLGGRDVSVDNIKIGTAPSVTVTSAGTGMYVPKNILDVNPAGQLYFDLTNMPVGTIYENVTVTPDIKKTSSTKNVITKTSDLEFGDVFTFPEFSIIQMNSKFYVRLKPFTTNNTGKEGVIDGSYLLKNGKGSSTVYNPSVTQWTNGSDEYLYFPLTISSDTSAGGVFNYQLFFNPKNKTFSDLSSVIFEKFIHSQQYKYTVASDAGNIKTPENFVVNDYSLSAIAGVDKKDEMNLSLDVSFDIAVKSQLKKMLENSPTNSIDVYYTLTNYLTPNPNDKEQVEFTYVKIHIDGSTDLDNPIATYYLSETEGDFSSPFSTIKDVPLQSTYRADINADVYYADFLFDVRAKRTGGNPNLSGREINFAYPNIYFLTVGLDYLDRNGDGSAIETAVGSSGFESITLNDISDRDVPPPQSVTIDNITDKAFDINWKISGAGVKEYIAELYTKSELTDIKKNIGYNSDGKPMLNAYYNIYIGTNETYLNNTFSMLPLPDSSDIGYTSTRINKSNVYTTTNSKAPLSLDVASTKGDSGKVLLDTLRETNGVVMLANYPIFLENDYTDIYSALQDIYDNKTNIADSLSLTGLDKNKKYYVYIDLVIENQLDKTNNSSFYKKASKLSPLTGATTLSDIDVPDDDDKVPPSPELKLVDTSVDTVALSWPPVVVTNSDGTKSEIQYDIIRIRDYQMDSKYLTTKESYTYTWDNFLPKNATNIFGYRTDINGATPFIKQYNSVTDIFEATKSALLDPKTIGFQDFGLTPNKVYFYYVRAVRTLSDGTLSYSNWSRISATTTNIENPTNLRINTSYEPYDAKTQVVLNFDAPVSDISKIGVDYDFYYCIKKDGGAWSEPILMNASTLKNGATGTVNSITNFNYIVSNLSPGTSYTFKVKMVDKTTNASSLYSNDARAKTDVDQDEYDDDEKTDNWTDYIIKMLSDKMNEYYWIINEGSGKRDIVYREEKFAGFINSATDSFVTLLPAKEGYINNYYISAKSYEMLSQKNMGIKVIYKNTEYYVTAKALTDCLNQAKKDVNSGNTKDFYIKISISGNASSVINGENCLTDIMNFEIIATGFETTAKAYENEAYAKLMASLTKDNDDIADLIKDIKKYVDAGKSDLEIQELVYNSLPDIQEELLDVANDLFKDYLAGAKYNITISKTDGQIIISLLNASGETMVNAYYRLSGNWVLKNVITSGNKRTFTTNETGTYVFTGKVLYLPGLDGLDYANNVKDIIIKYGLDEYLGNGSTFNTSNKLTGNMIMGSVAKVMGMNALDNPVDFLKNKNIVASERVSRSNVTAGDMVYYLMKVYELKTGTSVENMNVTNFNATNNMTGLTSQNKKSVQIATQIGLIRDPKFNAKYEVTVKDFLYYLNRLNEIIKL